MATGIRTRTPSETEIYEAAKNSQTALQLGSIPSPDGTKDLTFTIVAFNKKTGEWVDTKTLQQDRTTMHKITTLAQTIICSHDINHPEHPMDTISYIDKNGIHIKGSSKVVKHNAIQINTPQLHEMYESAIHSDHERLLAFDQKFAEGEFKNLLEIELEIDNLPSSKLKTDLRGTIEENSNLSFSVIAGKVCHQLRVEYYRSLPRSLQCDETQQMLDGGRTSLVELNKYVRQQRTVQEPWLALTNMISSYVHSSPASNESVLFDSENDSDEHDTLFTSPIGNNKANLPVWARNYNDSTDSIGEDEFSDDLYFNFKTNPDAVPLFPDEPLVHQKPVQPHPDLDLFVSVQNKAMPQNPSHSASETDTDDEISVDEPSEAMELPLKSEQPQPYGKNLLEIATKLKRLEEISYYSNILDTYSNPENSTEVLPLIINDFELRDGKKEFTTRAINWVKENEKTQLMEMIRTISNKLSKNPEYKGDNQQEKYMLFYLATVFTIWHKGHQLSEKNVVRNMRPSILIQLFKNSIFTTNETLHPGQTPAKIK